MMSLKAILLGVGAVAAGAVVVTQFSGSPDKTKGIEPAKTSLGAPKISSRTPVQTAYLENCVGKLTNLRTQNPEFQYKASDTPSVSCDCLLGVLVKSGITDEEIAIYSEEDAALSGASHSSGSAESVQAMMASQRRLREKLGEERYKVVKKAGGRGLGCPGVLPTNLAELNQ